MPTNTMGHSPMERQETCGQRENSMGLRGGKKRHDNCRNNSLSFAIALYFWDESPVLDKLS